MAHNLSNSFNIRKEESNVFVQLPHVLDGKMTLHGPLKERAPMLKKKK